MTRVILDREDLEINMLEDLKEAIDEAYCSGHGKLVQDDIRAELINLLGEGVIKTLVSLHVCKMIDKGVYDYDSELNRYTIE